MRSLITLIESASGPDEHTADYYLSEGCGAFAYALWVAKGKPANGDIGLIANVDGDPWYGDGDSDEPTHDFEATHVFYIEGDGRTLDVLGYRDTNQMIEGFHIHANVEGPWSPDNFAAEWMGDDDSKPLYCTHEMVADALVLIQKHATFYGIVTEGALMETVRYFGGFANEPTFSDTQRYMRGWCPYFALALHDMRGWQIVGAGEHFAAQRPDGMMVDIRGVMTPEQFQDGIGGHSVEFSRDDLIQDIDSGQYKCGFYSERDLAKAKAMVRKLGVK